MPAPRDTRRPAGARSGRTSAPDLGAASRANTPARSPRGTQRPSFPQRESESRLEKRVRASLSPSGWDRSPAARPGEFLAGLRGQADLREGAARSRTQRPPRRAARCAASSALRAPGSRSLCGGGGGDLLPPPAPSPPPAGGGRAPSRPRDVEERGGAPRVRSRGGGPQPRRWGSRPPAPGKVPGRVSRALLQPSRAGVRRCPGRHPAAVPSSR